MPYIGKSPEHGNFSELTDVSGSFNGSTTQFALTTRIGGVVITPVVESALLISLNGVVQEPTTAYTVSGTNITFTSAPVSTDTFFGVVMGRQLDVGTPSDGTITQAKLASTFMTGASDIGAAIVDADLIFVDDGAGGTLRKATASRFKTYVEASAMAVTGNVTATGTVEPAGDTASGDNAAIGYTSGEGLILTGQGSTNDVTIKNDADADVLTVPTGTTNVSVAGNLNLSDASSVNISTPLLAGADHTYTGLTAQMLAGGAISAFDLVCVHTVTGEVVEADASAYATARVIGIAPAAISDTATGTVLLHGFIRDDTWGWTTGSTLYASETAGAMTHTAPTTDGAFVQVVGVALEPDVVYINPSMDVIEHA